jgi:hypothetical protein
MQLLGRALELHGSIVSRIKAREVVSARFQRDSSVIERKIEVNDR